MTARRRTREFLSVPKALREMPGVGWTAKALAAHLRFRQRDRETVSIGERRLATDLGMDTGTIGRARAEAERCGLIKILNRGERRRGQRFLYDARPVDTAESAPISQALLARGKCPGIAGTSAPESQALKCPQGAGTSAPEVQARKEVIKKNSAKKGKNCAADKPPPDPRIRAVIDAFSEAYTASTGNAYVVVWGKDSATVKRLLRQLDGAGVDPVAELQAATAAMLADAWGRERASIGLLAAQINTWRSKARPEQSREAHYASGF